MFREDTTDKKHLFISQMSLAGSINARMSQPSLEKKNLKKRIMQEKMAPQSYKMALLKVCKSCKQKMNLF